jgi:REP element-mobilizing transposase RayT
MPRRPRHELSGVAFHVMNRAVRGTTIFRTNRDFSAFATILSEGLATSSVEVISYQVLDNHFHFVMTCDRVADLSNLMHWFQGKHASNWAGAHRARGRGYRVSRTIQSRARSDQHLPGSRLPVRGAQRVTKESGWGGRTMVVGKPARALQQLLSDSPSSVANSATFELDRARQHTANKSRTRQLAKMRAAGSADRRPRLGRGSRTVRGDDNGASGPAEEKIPGPLDGRVAY